MCVAECAGYQHNVTGDVGSLASYQDGATGKYQANCSWAVFVQTSSGHPVSFKFSKLDLSVGDEVRVSKLSCVSFFMCKLL